MTWRFFFIALLTVASTFATDQPDSVVSRSGQFIAHGRAGSDHLFKVLAITNSNLVPLEPELLVVSAERIKKAFLTELKLSDRSGGKIHLVIRRDLSPESLTQIISTRYNDGWGYRVDLPDHLDEARLVRGVTHALLLDLANGTTASRSAELPLWLTEGLCRTLLSEIRPGYLLRPPAAAPDGGLPVTYATLKLTTKSPFSDVTGSIDPVGRVRQTFRTHTPLSFNDLSFMSIREITPDEFLVYQDSSHYFVYELLRMNQGPARLVAMIQSLPDFWNWQTAFFQAYHDQFSNMREAEKWWSLAKLELEVRNNLSNHDTSIEQLRLILTVETGIRTETGQLPDRTEMSVQDAVREFSFEDQQKTLSAKVQQLTVLAFRCPSDVLPIVDGYRSAILTYLTRRASGPGASVDSRLDSATRDRLLVKELIRQLDLLDQKRAQFHESEMAKGPVTRSARK